jgi:tRNA(Ile)-lysidine synthase
MTVSGGVDSMVLLFVLKKIQSYGYSNVLRVVHINHATRDGQDAEQKFVHDFCNALEIPCETVKLNNLNPDQNFEFQARVKRYDAFYDLAHEDELILLAHHLDDSFEWTMLQSLRSASIEGLIGVPVVNNRVIRPFMCVSKKQIMHFANCFDLPFIEDPTNESTKYERNFIRNEVIGTFKHRYPKYLKHYVHRHNEIARRLGMHLIKKNKTDYQISLGSNSVLIYSLANVNDYSGLEGLVLEGLKHLNPDSRGSVARQLENVVKGMGNGKVGPISLTNSVQLYMDHNLVFMTKARERGLKPMFNEFRDYTIEQFENIIADYIPLTKFHFDFPFLVLIEGRNLDKRDFRISFNNEGLQEKMHQYCSEGVGYSPALKLLREWSKKRNRHKTLRLNYLTSF